MKEIVGASGEINVPAKDAWEVIGSLGGLNRWFPMVTACRLEGAGAGAKRFCTLANGVEIKERIDEVDQKQMRVRYSITEGALPLKGYAGTVSVKGIGNSHSEITWYSEYTPEPEQAAELREMLRGAVAEGIKGLETYCQKQSA